MTRAEIVSALVALAACPVDTTHAAIDPPVLVPRSLRDVIVRALVALDRSLGDDVDGAKVLADLDSLRATQTKVGGR